MVTVEYLDAVTKEIYYWEHTKMQLLYPEEKIVIIQCVPYKITSVVFERTGNAILKIRYFVREHKI